MRVQSPFFPFVSIFFQPILNGGLNETDGRNRVQLKSAEGHSGMWHNQGTLTSQLRRSAKNVQPSFSMRPQAQFGKVPCSRHTGRISFGSSENGGFAVQRLRVRGQYKSYQVSQSCIPVCQFSEEAMDFLSVPPQSAALYRTEPMVS